MNEQVSKEAVTLGFRFIKGVGRGIERAIMEALREIKAESRAKYHAVAAEKAREKAIAKHNAPGEVSVKKLMMCGEEVNTSEHLKKMIVEPHKKITAGAWKKELVTLEAKYEKGKQPYAEVVTDLACVEVLQHNKKDLDRLLQNERNARERQTTKRRDELSL